MLNNFGKESIPHRIRNVEQLLVDLDEKLAKHIEEDERNMAAISTALQENTEAVKVLTQETREVVSIYRDWKGVANVGSKAQRFAVWIVKWMVVLAGLYTITEVVKEPSSWEGLNSLLRVFGLL